MYGQSPAGHRHEKNKNAARELWEAVNVEGKEDAPQLSMDLITLQGRRGIRALDSALARAAIAD
ncbi:MAG: hypothetical protein J2P21_00525 [Chloracidobacterium sp.]|nr:hypothetical protein [Chloracidobacterium sp.]